MGSQARMEETRYTYADYCRWETDDRYELIDGVPYLMSPSPNHVHQDISGKLYRVFGNHLEGKPCRVYCAPLDVRLNADSGDDTVVQPDVLVVCDKNKLDKGGVNGVPDLVIEVLSPSSRNYDSGLKLDIYLKAGVRECWIVNPEFNTVRIYIKNADGEETVKTYEGNDIIPVGILPGFSISLKEIFAAAKL